MPSARRQANTETSSWPRSTTNNTPTDPWCRDCITAAAETAVRNLTDPSCMPPRCCGDAVLPIGDENVITTTTTNNHDSHPHQGPHPAVHLLPPAARAS